MWADRSGRCLRAGGAGIRVCLAGGAASRAHGAFGCLWSSGWCGNPEAAHLWGMNNLSVFSDGLPDHCRQAAECVAQAGEPAFVAQAPDACVQVAGVRAASQQFLDEVLSGFP